MTKPFVRVGIIALFFLNICSVGLLADEPIGQAKTITELIAEAKQQITEVTPEVLEHRQRSTIVVLDVREPHEYDAGHIPGAINIPRGVLEFKISDHPDIKRALGKDSPIDLGSEIYLYCRSGSRSALAAQSLELLGFSRVYSLAGGFKAWSGADYAVEN